MGRSAARGPRAYARMALFSRAPGRGPGQGPAALRTPLQPPGFCPDFAARREVPLLLDAQCVRMLATQVRIAGLLLHKFAVYLVCSRTPCVVAQHTRGLGHVSGCMWSGPVEILFLPACTMQKGFLPRKDKFLYSHAHWEQLHLRYEALQCMAHAAVLFLVCLHDGVLITLSSVLFDMCA